MYVYQVSSWFACMLASIHASIPYHTIRPQYHNTYIHACTFTFLLTYIQTNGHACSHVLKRPACATIWLALVRPAGTCIRLRKRLSACPCVLVGTNVSGFDIGTLLILLIYCTCLFLLYLLHLLYLYTLF